MNPYEPVKPRIRFPIGEYAQLFYEAGIFNLYSPQTRETLSQPRPEPQATYDFTSDLIPSPSRGSQQTVEQIIAHGYLAVPQGEPETAIISDKHHTAWLGLDDVIHQIRHRYQLYSQNMYELDVSICEAHNAVFRQEAAQGCPANDRQWYAADKRTQLIYEQQRAERVNLWRDVTRVRTSIPETAQEYLSSYRKLSMLSDLRGDVP